MSTLDLADDAHAARGAEAHGSLGVLGLAALGIVFGDIGTERNAIQYSDFLKLPNDKVVEIGRHIAI